MLDSYTNLNLTVKKLALETYDDIVEEFGENPFTTYDLLKAKIETVPWILDVLIKINFLESYEEDDKIFYKLKGTILNINKSTENKAKIDVKC